jgi:hypothetical protein
MARWPLVQTTRLARSSYHIRFPATVLHYNALFLIQSKLHPRAHQCACACSYSCSYPWPCAQKTLPGVVPGWNRPCQLRHVILLRDRSLGNRGANMLASLSLSFSHTHIHTHAHEYARSHTQTNLFFTRTHLRTQPFMLARFPSGTAVASTPGRHNY